MCNVPGFAMRTFFRLSSVLAKPLAVRAAERLFTTPLQARRPGSLEREVLEMADRFAIPYSGNSTLVGYRWGDESAPIILLVHGWCTTASSYINFIDQLVNSGYQVVAYDGPAHGESPGNTACLTEWAASINATMKCLGNVHCIIGHSLGAGATVVASSLGLNTRAIVLLAPMVDIVQVTEEFAEYLSIPKKIIQRMRDYAWNKYRNISTQYGADWQDVFRSNYRVPTLIVHDKDDRDVDVSNALRMSEQWPWAELVLTERLGHRRILLNPGIIYQVIQFIKSVEVPEKQCK